MEPAKSLHKMKRSTATSGSTMLMLLICCYPVIGGYHMSLINAEHALNKCLTCDVT